MTYILVFIMLSMVVAAASLLFYMERRDRKEDRAETLRFQAMTTAERQEALVKAKQELNASYLYLDKIYKLWSGYKWGYRRNPYFIPYTVAKMEYSRVYRRVNKLEVLLAQG